MNTPGRDEVSANRLYGFERVTLQHVLFRPAMGHDAEILAPSGPSFGYDAASHAPSRAFRGREAALRHRSPSRLWGGGAMDLGQWGVFYFTDVLTLVQLTELAQHTEQLGYTALWYPEVLGYESLALGSFLLTQTTRLVIASGIANMYARDAAAAKQGQHTLAKLSGGRFL